MSDDTDLAHCLIVLFDQADDGTVTPYVLLDPYSFALSDTATAGAPLAALATRALWKVCRDGLAQQALEEAKTIQRRADAPLAYVPKYPELEDRDLPTFH